MCGSAGGQTTAARPDRGIVPGASYAISDTETISLNSGNVSLSIPLAALPTIAGARLGLKLNATYNSKLWNVTRAEARNNGMSPTYVVDTPQISDLGGWRFDAGYHISFRNAHEDFNYLMPFQNQESSGEWALMQHQYYKCILITPDGAEHELRPIDSAGTYNGTRPYLLGYYRTTPDTSNTSMRYYSYDGSHLFAVINPTNGSPSWTIYLPDGTQVTTSNGIERIRDTNNNSIKVFSDTNGTHYQDEQTGREIRLSVYEPSSNETGKYQVWYQTVTGIWQHIDINMETAHLQGVIYNQQDWNVAGGEQGEGTECTRQQVLFGSIPVVRSIVFPVTEPNIAPQQYSFGYDTDNPVQTTSQVQWTCTSQLQSFTRLASNGIGELSQMTVPSGAVVNYTYSGFGTTLGPTEFTDSNDLARRSVATKSVTHDGSTDTWHYDFDSLGIGGSVTAPDGSFTSERHHPNDPAFSRDRAAGDGLSGLTYRTNSSNKTLVEKHWLQMAFDGADTLSTGSRVDHVGFNTVVDAEYTSLLDGNGNAVKMTAKTYQYDYNGNLLQETDYDWFDPAPVSRDVFGVPTGVPAGATVLRVVNRNYYNAASTASSTNVYAKRSAGGTPVILNALQQTTSGPAISRFSYDGQAYGTAPTVGNPTSQSVWDDLNSKWITTSQTYGAYGNIATKTDGRDKVTQFFYDDATHALPNRVVVDPQNGSGTQTATTVYDYYTGLVTSQTDANGNASTVDYTNQLLGTVDPFGRPGVISSPAVGGQSRQTRTFYADSLRTVRVVSDLNSANDGILKSESVSDTLGRILETHQYETTNDYITVKHAYDNVNRIEKTSNPFRAGEPVLWTTAVTDVLGRVISVTTPDSAMVSTSYNANTVTVTDQTGKNRKSVSDALGRLTQVYEDPNGLNGVSPLNDLTRYTYDVLGNLRRVDQGEQQRFFMYDSLSRLIRAKNPEQAARSSISNLTDAITENNQWSIAYSYDENGNLTQKTDPRGVVSTYAYDALNRNRSVSYDPASTPAVNRYYDGWRDGASASPSIPNSLGRLWQTETSGAAGSRTTINGFDALGRPSSESQQFYASSAWGQAYTTQREYNLAGGITSQAYPSGRTVTYSYDNAGRATTFTGNLGDGQQKTYASEILYSPFGSMTKEKFGTDTVIYNKLFYNSRGQLAEIRESSSWTGPTDTTWDRGAIINYYSNNCWGMCGGSNSTTAMTDNNGNLKKQEVFVPNNEQNTSATSWLQQYDYDSLNRLQRVHETTGNTQTDWQQEYVYDRYGNRTIHQTNTYGLGVNKKDFTVNTANNRLGVPGGQSGAMTYDDAGNLTIDTYSGAAELRAYDAENRMTKETQPNSVVAGEYTYNADGQRVRRKVNSVETWQVYGFDGELLAEYAQNGGVTGPQKEYGYRNGQLLITADAAPSQTIGSTPNAATFVTQSVPQTMVAGHHYAVAVTFRNSGSNTWTTAEHYNLGVANDNGVWGLYRVALPSTVAPNQEVTFNFTITAPTTPGTYNFQWRVVQDYVEWFGDYSTNLPVTVTGATGNGGNAAECVWQNVPATMIAGQSYSLSVRLLNSGSNTWTTAAHYNLGSANDNGAWGLYRVALTGPVAPNEEVTFNFTVTAPATPGSYNFQWRMVQDYVEWFGDYSTNVPVVVSAATTAATTHWLVADQLGTPRMIFDKTGALANVKRHDYAPFGEELVNGARPNVSSYAADSTRQKFTSKERDNETGLEYSESRYYSSIQGRFTSPDEPFADQEEDDPQSWNLYSYVRNNPLRFVDPSGEGRWEMGADGQEHYVGDIGEYDKDLNATWDGTNWNSRENNGQDNTVRVEPEAQPIAMTAGVLALALSPPPVKLAAAGGALLIGGAALLAYLDRDIIHVPAPFTGPSTLVNPSKIEILGSKPPPPPILKKKGEKKQVRAAARHVGVTYIALRNAIHQYKKQNGMKGNENLDWETLIMVAEEIRKRLEK
ncbi:MAG TPA: hypothetical protein DC047_18670 [Blastocatellia bacterium]|nr:hypothetical protein [Blastocatellia bacterium]